MSRTTADENVQARIDAVLDAALDALDSDDEDSDDDLRNMSRQGAIEPSNNNSADASRKPMGPPPPPPESNRIIEQTIEELLEENSDSDIVMGRMLQEMLRMSAQQQQEIPVSARSPPRQSQQDQDSSDDSKPSSTSAAPNISELDEAISNLVNGMAKQSSISSSSAHDGSSRPENCDYDDTFLSQILQGLQLQQPGSPLDSDAVIDGMMEHLLAKELMYEPMKQVTLKFPQWLKERKIVLSEQEFKERTKQYNSFCELVRVYETEPENTAKLMTLMHDVHEYGQPPIEIINEIAPGIELDEDGLPKSFDGFNEECRIM